MSLAVCLTTKDIDGNEIDVYDANITHNLGRMADAARICEALWHPEERGWAKAGQIVPILEDGLANLKENPEHFAQSNASNGGGCYEHFVPFVEKYLDACKKHPSATIYVSR